MVRANHASRFASPAIFAALVALAGCAVVPVKTYSGPARDVSEVAVLRDTANATVIALDGAPVSASAWSLLPGTHELILRVRIFTDAPNMHYTAWTHCHVYHAAEAGQQYTTRVRIEKKIAG
ncbi:MAG: hypothetical protein GY733_17450, partial [bacterium]|nr:hypothetical protein [bacterium]